MILTLPNSIRVLTSYVLLEQETWFEDEFPFVGKCMQPDECAVDVGANFGLYTAMLAQAVGPGGRVLAFEPAARTADFLRESMMSNAARQVEIIQAALSESAGAAALSSADGPEHNILSTNAPQGAHELVNVVTLDDSIREYCVGAVAFVKIDVEGHERAVARGALSILERDEPLVMFEVSREQADFGFLDEVRALGFEAYRLIPGPGLLAPLAADDPIDGFLLNLFAGTPGRASMLESRQLLARGAGTVAAPASYEEALGYHAISLSNDATPADRIAHLARSRAWLQRACAEQPTIPRLLSYSRVAADAGRRAEALGALNKLIELSGLTGQLSLHEPALAPHPRYDTMDPGDDTASWIKCAVLETCVRRHAFSTLFSGTQALGLLEQIRSLPFYCAEMERRRQLIRICHERQRRPEPHPLVCRIAPDNLNPGLWSGNEDAAWGLY
jgi:FkbM family methyltransferase